MNKIKLVYLSSIGCLGFLFFAACSTNATKESVVAESNDSLLNKLSTLPKNAWPFLLNDSSILNKTPLSASSVLSFINVSDTLNEEWEINSFLKIDSLKQQNKYEAYLESLDIAQVKDAEAFTIDTLSVGSCTVLIWGLKFSSYEACPYFSGNKIYITSLSKTKTPIRTVAILNNSSSGDAPYYAFTNGSCLVYEDGTINCTDSTEQGGETVTKGTKELEEVINYSNKRIYKIESDGYISEIENKKFPTRTAYHE